MDIKKPLQEKNFISNTNGKELFSSWIFTLLLFFVAATLFYMGSWLTRELDQKPFLKVTNRDFSLFLWQNTEYMRANVQQKTGYLPGYNKADQMDEYVIVPPEVLFLYHTWKRLVGDYFIPRSLPSEKFQEFLSYDKGSYSPYQDYMGWTNYYYEGDQINELSPTYGEVEDFLKIYGNYNRNFWRNLFPDYLKGLVKKDPNEKVPKEEIPSFLRVALFNYSMVKKPSS